MRLAAALLAGFAVYLLAGFLTGRGPRLEWPARSKPTVSARQLWLTQAGVDLSPRQFWAVSVTAGGFAFLLVVLLTRLPILALVPAVFVGLAPRAYFGRLRMRRLSEVAMVWPDGLRDLVASISAGMSLQRAIENLADKGPAPLQRAFERFPLLTRTLGVVPALEIIKEELADPTSDRVIEVLIIAQQRGGNIVGEILTDLAEATTRDLWTMEEVRTAALEQKINARVVFVLPWAVLVALTAFEESYRDFYGSRLGVLVVFVGALMSGFGIWVVGRLGRDPEEQRVLGGSAVVVGASK
ncbi:MAG: type II secretion system F family protein [Acidimicrobiia bacterium]|nr:type II secretion system F family protein [Acidimicrobiia bacterium]